MKNKSFLVSWLIPILLTVLFIAGRVICYGAMNDSVGAHDTGSYYEVAREDFGISFFSQMRSATLPLIIKTLNPNGSYEIIKLSEPFFGSEPELVVNPGTESLIQFQTILSIISWIIFALILCSHLRHPLAKAAFCAVIYLFAFVPQLADWDSLLLSESISFSLFVLMDACLFQLIADSLDQHRSRWNWLWAAGFIFCAFFWTFTRDTNAYFLILCAVMLLAIELVSGLRQKKWHLPLLLCSFLLIGLFFFQQQTFKKSERWLLPLLNNMTTNIFPYENRVDFFRARGMPFDETIADITGSAEYNQIYEQTEFIEWARRDGLDTYQAFLLDMPLWSVLQIYQNLDNFFSENIQPFFYGKPDDKPLWANQIGNLLHPLSASVIVIDCFLLLLLCVTVLRKVPNSLTWLLFCLILFLGGGLMMAIAYLGEVRSIWRHVLCGVMPLRLVMWLMFCVLLDQNLHQSQ